MYFIDVCISWIFHQVDFARLICVLSLMCPCILNNWRTDTIVYCCLFMWLHSIGYLIDCFYFSFFPSLQTLLRNRGVFLWCETLAYCSVMVNSEALHSFQGHSQVYYENHLIVERLFLGLQVYAFIHLFLNKYHQAQFALYYCIFLTVKKTWCTSQGTRGTTIKGIWSNALS